MDTELLSPAARRLLNDGLDNKPITLDEALAVCPWRTLLGRGRDAANMMRRLGVTVAIVDHERSPMSADILVEAVAALGRGETVLLIAARREDGDFAKVQILAMAAGDGACA